ncbi:16S rRNA (guanine(527)-N(7))-methyltransferase RsmG [candidate division WOR-1 bacterium RIFOXYA12_FULL_43_27]|uniref:Ribosomal RNA small subunit methyltransferase G n=1 Tax=candidate division WOR-1 bacterium RIFOXYC2_FULL_46_14 TaxID=1802587 RepID=A0A1F4U6R1_UNCSA|nr:MAG: 16S rRNA (guanine(527)-N(7))-methyltransferase RsmG [candidate division WOR-1 bacterium RIFOXYA12_FULL_43_27]OGC19590.1 MAG: 16S rRNA (guanine(527)-N(7))-methyltransferase RsmG [candidate division WOR-1 bacterium RIFOXYB2_FULL_46_45]OGC30579.1 MAG: 16S rRNA (guanine(527)-N(7))-methyltransferase RsmG [candidate division WOR-1 bacterium RIFOXYA2_FULL_46_56]OGC40646.1 MAG: 16S rRNA (guanine(527)-N(7))-methyltransferase RsmG [candidate division WOR-1 bacterium RIFOXYC2_FULL_46_14]
MDDKFEKYIEELLLWNKKFNLTSITDPKEIKIKHFEDSLSILQAIDLTNQSVVDIGSGAGFPGIPLKLARPGILLTLIEATRKKTEFLNHIVKTLGLSGVVVVWGRAETLKNKYAEKFDVAVARAVAKLPELIKLAFPLLKPGGILIAQKGPNVEPAGVKVKEIKEITLSNGHKRTLVVVEKATHPR